MNTIAHREGITGEERVDLFMNAIAQLYVSSCLIHTSHLPEEEVGPFAVRAVAAMMDPLTAVFREELRDAD